MNRSAPKPLGIKAYGSIPHLPSSRMGSGDHHCHEGQGRICLERVRDRHDVVFVEEKLDGSCVAVVKIAGSIVPLGRAGYPAISSPYLQHRLFHNWAWEPPQYERFMSLLVDGERLIGEWLAQAHGTRYSLTHEPFVAFDLMRGPERAPRAEFERRVAGLFVVPRIIRGGINSPFSLEEAVANLEPSGHGALDPVEGAVWRVERRGEFDFLAKWVRADKVDGVFLPEIAAAQPVWNWQPT